MPQGARPSEKVASKKATHRIQTGFGASVRPVVADVKVARAAWAAARGAAADAAWGDALVAAFTLGRARWPGVAVPLTDFVAHVARVTPADRQPESLEAGAGEGLYLCAACLSGDARALAHFEEALLQPLGRVIGKMEGGRALADDVLQDVRAQFCSPPAGRPSAFLAYSGRGALGTWLKVLAVRAAQKHRRGAARNAEVADEGVVALPAADGDPELRFLKQQHRQHFRAVFTGALASLDSRERSVLRMSLVEGLAIDDLAKVYDVHRATAARWLSSARERLVQQTRQRLAARLNVSEAELDEVMGAVQSHLSISLATGLASKGPTRR